MVWDNSVPRARASGFPFFRIMVSFPIACFSGALITDIAYTVTADMLWADFSAWLLAVGMFTGVLAAIAGVVDCLAYRRALAQIRIWPGVVGSVAVLILGLFDNLVHSRDAWTSVVPMGLALSAITVVIMLITAWAGFGRPSPDEPLSGVRQ